MGRYFALILGYFVTLFPCVFPQEDKRVHELIQLLESQDPEASRMAYEELLRYGASILPILKERIHQKGTALHMKLMQEITRSPEGGASKEAQRYLMAKYKLALKRFQEGKFSGAKQICQALLILEPVSELVDKLKRLIKLCEQRELQEKFLMASISSEKPIYKYGDKVSLELIMLNVSDRVISLSTGKEGAEPLIIERIVTAQDHLGNTFSRKFVQTGKLDPQIRLEPKGSWRYRFQIDTGEQQRGHLETYLVSATLWLAKPLGQGSNQIMKIEFVPFRFRVFPERVLKAKDPLRALREAMEKGPVSDVFLYALLLEGDQRREGIKLFMEALEVVRSRLGRRTIFTSLRHLTGLRFGDDAGVWRSWWKKEGQ
jgi:hypothetical protein